MCIHFRDNLSILDFILLTACLCILMSNHMSLKLKKNVIDFKIKLVTVVKIFFHCIWYQRRTVFLSEVQL